MSLAPLRIGLVGAGRVAQQVHLKVLTRLPEVKVAALAEPNEDHRRTAQHLVPKAKSYTDVHPLLEDDEIEAVLICLPNALHAEAALAALERGKHVYLEKPLATNLTDAEAVVTTWRQTGVTGMMGFNYRYNPLYQSLKGHLHPSRFHAALDTGDIDVLMNAVNFVCQHTYDFEHKVWSRASREGVACMCMKTLGGFNGGGSFRLPEEFYERAIRYSLSIPGVSGSVIGVKTIAELEKAAKTVAAYKPLSVDEARQLAMEGLKLSATDDLKTAYGRPLT